MKDRAATMGSTSNSIIVELKDDRRHRVSAGNPQLCTKVQVHSYLYAISPSSRPKVQLRLTQTPLN